MSIQDAGPAVQDAFDKGRRTAERATETIKDFVDEHKGDFDVRQFVRDEPWIAVAAAFAVGYLAARLLRRAN